MAAATAPRKTISIHDYPEHLNPFHEDDNHNKIRFWTLGRRLTRSNSISFSGLKDLKNSWALRSFMKKGKKEKQTSTEKINNHNGDNSPILYRRAMQYSTSSRSTVGSPEGADRYVYGGSVTPLPRSRFQERLRSTSHNGVDSLNATPRMARSEVSGSRLSVESTNPFDEYPVPPVRASRRKKKRAPPPPGSVVTSPDTTVTSVTSELHITETNDKSDTIIVEGEADLEEHNLNVELKIVEDEDIKDKSIQEAPSPDTENNNIIVENTAIVTATNTETEQKLDNEQPDSNSTEQLPSNEDNITNSNSEEDILNSVKFNKVDIVKYRRNSSVNEDDIKLRRGNLEDYQLSNKRSKSLTNALNTTFTAYDLDLNENTIKYDTNGNDEPHKVVCKLYDKTHSKHSIDTVSSTEREFQEIDRATKELEREINKLNSALNDEDLPQVETRMSVSEIKKRFDKNDVSSPNPIPKPRRSHYGGGSTTP